MTGQQYQHFFEEKENNNSLEYKRTFFEGFLFCGVGKRKKPVKNRFLVSRPRVSMPLGEVFCF
jgi:hypothetical protein